MSGRRALVLGGTAFVGRHLVDALLADGWDITLFNRGQTNPGLFPAVTQLVGDRDGDVSALAEGRPWDVVFDVAAYAPDQVDRCARLLAGRCDLYVFVSTISAYAALPEPGMTEDSPLAALEGPLPDEPTNETYGALKVLCERQVAAWYPQHTIVRPTVIVGPHDPTDRFTYWPVRLHEPGPHVMPADPGAMAQYLDVRDLAAWLVRLGARRTTGTFNAAAPPLPLRELLARIARGVEAPLDVIEIAPETLEAEGLRPWVDLPLWISPDDREHHGMLQVSTQRAVSAGLVIRPVEQTARDTLAWAADRAATQGWQLSAGLSPDREAALIAGLPAAG
jgi:2'-hydroxyisoflavone reductase